MDTTAASAWRHRTARGSTFGPLLPRGESPQLPRSGLFATIATIGREVSAQRHALRVFVTSQFRATHRAQALGVFWPIANPLLLTIVLSVVFGTVFPTDVEGYPVFLLLGLVLWNFVSHAWTEGTRAFVNHAPLLKHTEMPPHLVVLGTVLSSLIALGFASLSLLPLVAAYPDSFQLTPWLALLPVVVGLVVVLAYALSLMTAVLHVIYRDIAYLVDSILLVFFWLTPIVYPIDRLSHGVRRIVLINPMAALLTCVRDIVIGGRAPPPQVFGVGALCTFALLLVGVLVYRRHAPVVADSV